MRDERGRTDLEIEAGRKARRGSLAEADARWRFLARCGDLHIRPVEVMPDAT